jgi:hypothetical protein
MNTKALAELPRGTRLVVITDQIAALATFICIAFIFVMGYWGIFDTRVPVQTRMEIEFFHDGTGDNPENFKILKEVRAGQRVHYYRDVCLSNRSTPPSDVEGRPSSVGGPVRGIIRSKVVDGYIILMPDRPFTTKEGCYRYSTPLKIPSSLQPGEYSYQSQAEYFRNPLQLAFQSGVLGPVRTINFTVVK